MVLVVNNLGGTSNIELCIVANAAIRHLGIYTVALFIITSLLVSVSPYVQW